VFAQIQFAKLTLADTARQLAAKSAIRFQLAPERFVGVALVHAALERGSAGRSQTGCTVT
jgi:hypothetical protein